MVSHFDVLRMLCSELDLGAIQDFSSGTKGMMNEKYRVVTDRGIFFVKVIENVPDEVLRYVHDVEAFMFLKGIPTVPELPGKKAVWLRFGNTAFKPYPFIESVKKTTYSLRNLEDMAVTLARIHWAGQRDVPSQFLKYSPPKMGRVHGLKIFQDLEKKIALRENLDENDQRILDHLNYKIHLIPELEEGSLHFRETLVHGDFHIGNILFNEKDEIIAVCDWEKTHYGSRSFDLAYTMIFSCFRLGDVYEEALSKAQRILNAYRNELPITNMEIEQGVKAVLNFIALSSSLEEEYYGRNRYNVVNLIDHQRKVIEILKNPQFTQDLLHFS